MKNYAWWSFGSCMMTTMLFLMACTALSSGHIAPNAVVNRVGTPVADVEVVIAKQTIEGALNNRVTPTPNRSGVTPTLVAPIPDLDATATNEAQQLATAVVAILVAQGTATPDLAATQTQIAQTMATAIAATLTANAPPAPTPNLAATQTAAAHAIATAVQATLMAKPTATLPVPSPTPTSTPRPTNTALPTAPPLAFHPISLSQIANASTQEGYVDPPLGSRELNGILFDLPPGQNSVTTQAEPLPSYPIVLVLPNLDIQLPQAVYLLITGGNTRAQFQGAKIGTVDLIFSNNQHVTEELIPGHNLREWKIYGDHNVTWTTATNISEVWQTPNHHDSGLGIIDLLTITIPPPLREQTLREIRIYDQSQETVNSMDPAINLLGVTVLGQE